MFARGCRGGGVWGVYGVGAGAGLVGACAGAGLMLGFAVEDSSKPPFGTVLLNT